jgi:hypothetical protein
VSDISDATEALEGQLTHTFLLAEHARPLQTLYHVNRWEYKHKKRIGESLNDPVNFGDQEACQIAAAMSDKSLSFWQLLTWKIALHYDVLFICFTKSLPETAGLFICKAKHYEYNTLMEIVNDGGCASTIACFI